MALPPVRGLSAFDIVVGQQNIDIIEFRCGSEYTQFNEEIVREMPWSNFIDEAATSLTIPKTAVFCLKLIDGHSRKFFIPRNAEAFPKLPLPWVVHVILLPKGVIFYEYTWLG